MHVLYLIDSLVPGGAEQSLAALAPRYVAKGIDLDVAYLLDRPGLQAELREAGAELFSLAGKGGRVTRIRRARALVLRRKPDIVHTTLFEADLAGRTAARLAGIPVVSSLVNPEYGPEQLSDKRLASWRVRGAQAADAVTARLVSRFHAISYDVADVMSRRLLIPRRKIDVIPRGRDLEALGTRTEDRRLRTRRGAGVGAETAVILAAARQEYQKGLDVLVRALPRVLQDIPDVVLLLAGREGAETARLRTMVESMGLDSAVRLLGPRSDIPDLLSAADVFVLPSRWEGLGGVVLEAMALEAPIVASDLPPVRDAVDGERGAMLVPPDRPEELAKAIVASLREPAEAHRRAARAQRRFLERFTLDRVVDGMLAFYERALSET